MAAKRPSRPWRLMMRTSGVVVESKHRSCPEAYREVAAQKEKIANGTTRVTSIRVEKWNNEQECWDFYERAYPEN